MARSAGRPGWIRILFGSLGGAVLTVALLGVALAAFVGGFFARGVTALSSSHVAAGDVTVVRTRGSALPDGDECVDLELRVGEGVLTRHRTWRRCEDASFGWEVFLSSDGRRGSLSYASQRCTFAVDRDGLRFAFDDPERTCGFVS